MKLREAISLSSVVFAAFCLAGAAKAQDWETLQIDEWLVSGQSDGRGACSLEQASSGDFLRFSSNGAFYVAGGAIGEVDTRRPTSLVLVIDGRPETVRATASFRDGEYGYSFSPRRRPSFVQDFDLELLRGEQVVFRYQVTGADRAYDEMLECSSDFLWPDP